MAPFVYIPPPRSNSDQSCVTIYDRKIRLWSHAEVGKFHESSTNESYLKTVETLQDWPQNKINGKYVPKFPALRVKSILHQFDAWLGEDNPQQCDQI